MSSRNLSGEEEDSVVRGNDGSGGMSVIIPRRIQFLCRVHCSGESRGHIVYEPGAALTRLRIRDARGSNWWRSIGV